MESLVDLFWLAVGTLSNGTSLNFRHAFFSVRGFVSDRNFASVRITPGMQRSLQAHLFL